MADLSLLWAINVTVIGTILAGIIRFYTYKAEQEKKISELKLEQAVQAEKLAAQKVITDHLTRAGEDMKKEFGQMNNILTQVFTEVKHISKDVQDLKQRP